LRRGAVLRGRPNFLAQILAFGEALAAISPGPPALGTAILSKVFRHGERQFAAERGARGIEFLSVISAMADLLFLAHRLPYPPEKGDRIRSWHILRHLAERHRVHLGCFYDDPADKRHIAELEKVCASVICLPIHPLFRRVKSLGALRSGEAMSIAYFRD
jgi:hypothetical protein